MVVIDNGADKTFTIYRLLVDVKRSDSWNCYRTGGLDDVTPPFEELSKDTDWNLKIVQEDYTIKQGTIMRRTK